MKDDKRILFVGYNFTPELTGIGKYSGCRAQPYGGFEIFHNRQFHGTRYVW